MFTNSEEDHPQIAQMGADLKTFISKFVCFKIQKIGVNRRNLRTSPSGVIASSPSDRTLSSKIPPLSPDRVQMLENPLRIPRNGKVNHDLDQFERTVREMDMLEENPSVPANRESREPAETRGWTGLKVNLPVFLSKTGGEGGIRTPGSILSVFRCSPMILYSVDGHRWKSLDIIGGS